MLSQGKREGLVDTTATTHASSIRSIQTIDLGDESKVVSTDIVAIKKQEVYSIGKENSSNIQSANKVKKGAREDNGGHKTQVSIFISFSFVCLFFRTDVPPFPAFGLEKI